MGRSRPRRSGLSRARPACAGRSTRVAPASIRPTSTSQIRQLEVAIVARTVSRRRRACGRRRSRNYISRELVSMLALPMSPSRVCWQRNSPRSATGRRRRTPRCRAMFLQRLRETVGDRVQRVVPVTGAPSISGCSRRPSRSSVSARAGPRTETAEIGWVRRFAAHSEWRGLAFDENAATDATVRTGRVNRGWPTSN